MSDKILKKFVVFGCESHNTNVYHTEKRFDDLVKIPIALNCLDESIIAIKAETLPDVLHNIVHHPLVDEISIALALAICAKSENISVRSIVLKNFSKACLNPTTVLYFVKCIDHLKKTINNSKESKVGTWGKSTRNALKAWYGALDAQSMAKMFISEKKSYGWSHTDVLKLIHFKAASKDVEAAIKYFGFGKAREELNEDLKLIADKVDEIKTCEDPQRVVALLDELKMGKSAVPSRFARSTAFWSEYLPTWEIKIILKRLENLMTSKDLAAFLEPLMKSMILDADASLIDPSEVYIFLRRYEGGHKNLHKERDIAAKKLGDTELALRKNAKKKAKHSHVYKPNPLIVGAMQGLLARSLTALPKENGKWLLCLYLTSPTAGPCTHQLTVTVGGAAALTAHYSKQVASEVDVLVPSQGIVSIDADVAKTTEQFQKLNVQAAGLKQTFDWACDQSPDADHVIFMSDQSRLSNDELTSLHNSIIKRRDSAPKTRYALVMLRAYSNLKTQDDSILLIHGFDAKVLRIIKAFFNYEI